MDRLIAINSVPVAQADAAPATGTPQYATSGNPGTGQPATIWPAYQYNAIQEELIAIIVAGGLTPNRNALNQAVLSIQALIAAAAGSTTIGQCQLVYTSATALTLNPFNGQALTIGGAIELIPSGGVTLSNAGLSASTFYYIYAYMNSGTMTLEASTTAPTLGTNGMEVMTGNAAYTLVGAAFTNASTQFSDTNGARYTLSWFNRRWKKSETNFTTNRSTASTTFVELNSEIRNGFITWGTEDVMTYVGGTSTNSSTSPVSTAVGFDGTTAEPEQSTANVPVSNAPGQIDVDFQKAAGVLAQAAAHYATLLGAVLSAGGGTGTWYASNSPGAYSQVYLGIAVNG